jgi:hypothetical protein
MPATGSARSLGIDGEAVVWDRLRVLTHRRSDVSDVSDGASARVMTREAYVTCDAVIGMGDLVPTLGYLAA